MKSLCNYLHRYYVCRTEPLDAGKIPAFTGSLGSILQGDWELLLYEHDMPLLFNVQQDPAEASNLAGQLQQLEQDLAARLADLAAKPAHLKYEPGQPGVCVT